MIQIENILYEKVKSEILKWEATDIYAISFFVYSNESFEYENFHNVPIWDISYNTESECNGAGDYDEERWNYAFWFIDEISIIDTEADNPYTQALYKWYSENGIQNIGEEDYNANYDEKGCYIGKGPVGLYELVCIAKNVAKRLQKEGFLVEHFGKALPIIIHDYEYSWYHLEATKEADIHGEADVFLKAIGFLDNLESEMMSL